MSLNQWSVRITLTLQLKHFFRLFWKNLLIHCGTTFFEDALTNCH